MNKIINRINDKISNHDENFHDSGRRCTRGRIWAAIVNKSHCLSLQFKRFIQICVEHWKI